jgi:cell division protein FtsL
MTPRTTSARRSHAASPARSRPLSPTIPRRVSGPVSRRVTATAGAALRPLPTAPVPAPALGRGPLERVMALPDHRLLDRLLRGRLWIWMIGIALGGIVAMQVSLLKLNTGISRAVQTSATLEHQNAALETGIARLSSQERIQSAATALGMDAPEAGDVVHVRARGAQDGRRAATRMSEPSDHARAMVAAGADGAAPATAGQTTVTSTAPAPPSTGTPPAPVPSAAAGGAPVTATPVAPAPAAATTTAPAPAPVTPPSTTYTEATIAPRG